MMTSPSCLGAIRNRSGLITLAGFLLYFTAYATASPALAAKISCENWNSTYFLMDARVADVSRCLKAGADVHAKGATGKTPLHEVASWNENPAVIGALIKAGADVHSKDAIGRTPLHAAAFYNENPAMIAALIKAGADVHAKDRFGTTPLYDAAYSNKNPAVMTALVAAGADVHARDEDGETPLQLAKEKGKAAALSQEAVAAFREKERKVRAAARKQEIEQRLRTARVSCDRWNTAGFFRNADSKDLSRCLKTKDANARDGKGRTPLHNAAMSGKPDLVVVLAKAGAKPNARDQKDWTPLHSAGALGKTPAVVAALVKAGADLNARDKRGRTPLEVAEKFSQVPAMVAALKKEQPSCKKWNTAAFFNRAGLADVRRCLKTKDANARNKSGRTPLHYAAQGKSPQIVAALSKAGAAVNARDKRGGWTPLHLAAWYSKSPAVVEALLDNGADPAAKDSKGKTPWDYGKANAALKKTDLHRRLVAVSCEAWNTRAFFERADAPDVSRCLKAGGKVSARDETGRTPLHVAARHSEVPAVVAALVKAGARLSARDETGATPLHTAAAKGKTPAVVEALLDAGADAAAKDEDGRTPRDYAKGNAALKGTGLHRSLGALSCDDWNTKAFFEHADVTDVSRCLKAGAKVSARDAAGTTPLHAAAFKSGSPVVKALLDSGADPAAKDGQGKTPWNYAKENPALKGTDVYWQLNEGRFK